MSFDNLIISKERLGEGGFGSVFVAHSGNVKVAAKRLSQSEKEIVNITNEAARIKRLQHGKYIAYTYGIALMEESLYMVMEYCERGDLQNYLKANKDSVTYEQKILFCRGILLGILYCHSMKVFHGDIKCSNVILGKNLEPKLTDFGLSMTVENIEGYSKIYKGSIHWAAPELFSMEEEGSFEKFRANPYPTDVYSLGATFCQVSFDGTTEFIDSNNIEMDVSLGFVSPISKDAFLKEITDKCCQFERNERISLDECLTLLDAVAEEQLQIPDIDDKWLGIQQNIKANSKLDLPPSFILHRPAENLVVGPSNLSLLEWLCINNHVDAVKYLIQLHEPEPKHIEWLYGISELCGSSEVAKIFQNATQNSEYKPLYLLKLFDANPQQFIEIIIEAGANCDDDILIKAIELCYNKAVQIITAKLDMFERDTIFNAIWLGNTEALRILAEAGIDLENKSYNASDTPLLAAISAENVEMVKILLECNANVHNRNSHARSNLKIGGQNIPLYRAALKGNREIVQLLVDAGATVDIGGSEWHSLVQDLEDQGNSNMAQFIRGALSEKIKTLEKTNGLIPTINDAANGNAKQHESTILCIAIQNSQPDIVQRLINDGASANEEDYSGYMPLHWAVMIGNEEIVKILLTAGADIDVQTPSVEQSSSSLSPNRFYKSTPLHIAITKRHLGIVRLLIESGADFSSKDELEQVITDVANEEDQKEIESIIRNSAPADDESLRRVVRIVNAKKVKKISMETVKAMINKQQASIEVLSDCLCIAAFWNNMEAVNYLLECGANVDKKYKDMNSLECAMSAGHIHVVQTLINAGADFDVKTINEKSILSLWVKQSCRDIVQLLIGMGADVNARDNYKVTPLCYAENKEIAEILINSGAEVNASSSLGWNPLFQYTYRSLVDLVQLLVDKGADVNTKYENGCTPLYYAESKEIAKILINAGADVNASNSIGWTPLFECVKRSLMDIVQFLVDKGVDVNAKYGDGYAPLCYAENKEIAEMLINAGANVNASSSIGCNPLFEYVRKSLIDMVQLLVDKGADVNFKDKNRYTPLRCAENKEIAEILINAGADVNASSSVGWTPLFECVRKSLSDMVQFLVDKGADVNAKYEDGCTPLHYAENKEIVEILINAGADVNASSSIGWNPLFEYVEKSLMDMVQLLLDRGADVNARGTNACTSLHYAKNKEVAEILINAGADVNTSNSVGWTPLFEFVKRSLVDVVQFLVDKGADVNAECEDGCTPLHYAENKEIVEILINAGADVNASNSIGWTPLFEYVKKSLMDMVQLLLDRGVDVNAKCKDGGMPLHYAENKEIAEILINAGANVNASDSTGWTPLFECVKRSLMDMVQLLLDRGADVNAECKDGCTPLHYARNKEIAEILINTGANVNTSSLRKSAPLFEYVNKSLVDLVQLLLDKGTDVNFRDNNACTPLHFVENKEIAELLISEGADVNARDKDEKTPLFECVEKSLEDLVKLLLSKGAEKNIKDKHGNTLIHYARNRKIIDFLIEAGADINIKNNNGKKLLDILLEKQNENLEKAKFNRKEISELLEYLKEQ